MSNEEKIIAEVNSSMAMEGMPLTERLFSFGNGQLSYVFGSISFVGSPYN